MSVVDLYVIRRRSGFSSLVEINEASERSETESNTPGSEVCWIRTYVVVEEDDRLGTFDVYQAASPEAIRAHASSAELPVDAILPVADTILVRPDPISSET